jgi:hypothetical protein
MTIPGHLSDKGDDGISCSSRDGVGSKKNGLVSAREMSLQQKHLLRSRMFRAYAISDLRKDRGVISSDEKVLADDFRRQQEQQQQRDHQEGSRYTK